jgi:hypothetical protein
MGRQAVKLSKRQILQILVDILLICWFSGLWLKTSLLFWIPIAVILPLMGIVVCWGQIEIRRKP